MLAPSSAWGQPLFSNPRFAPDSVPNPHRRHAVTCTAAGGYVAMGLYLGTVWYAQDTLGPFHFFDDSREWKQIDKFGHALGAFTASRWMSELYIWSGTPRKKAAVTGAVIGFAAMSSIEILDGFGKDWGASVSDIGANFVGSSLFLANQLLWEENRIALKFSYLPSPFVTNKDSLSRYSRVFGANPAEWLLKDYNGHTYWLSVRVHSFLPEGRFKEVYPRWLKLAAGYGADGMTSGFAATSYRQAYIGFDVDITQLARAHGKPLYGPIPTLLNTAGLFRILTPALQMDKTGVAPKWLR